MHVVHTNLKPRNRDIIHVYVYMYDVCILNLAYACLSCLRLSICLSVFLSGFVSVCLSNAYMSPALNLSVPATVCLSPIKLKKR